MFLLTWSPQGGSETEAAATTAQKARPNIVFIMTDDMAYSDLANMPITKQLLASQGTTFRQSFVTYSLCCPTRATIQRGQYAHNHGIKSNFPPHGSFTRFKELGRDRSTVATWLDDAGYETIHLGKYMNNYSTSYVPPGWDKWNTYYGAFHKKPRLNNNGKITTYPDGTVLDEITRRKANFYIRNTSGPMYLQLDTHAPHTPNQYPKKYSDKFKGAKAPRYISTNEKDVSDKPKWVSNNRLQNLKAVDTGYQRRLRSLLIVDDTVGTVVKALRETGKLNNTYIFFYSDNGWHYGEHRLQAKWTPYEEALRVPLVVRGPGVPKGKTRSEFVLSNDIAPTFADLAGATTPDFVDGRSIRPLVGQTSPGSWRHTFMYESWRFPNDIYPSPAPTYEGVRTRNFNYTEYATGEKELYGLGSDPRQVSNRYGAASNRLKSSLNRRLRALESCSGAECRAAEGW